MKKRFLETGKIVGTHGVRGMVRIQPWCDSFEFIKQFNKFYLDSEGKECVECDRLAPNGNVVIAKFRGIDNIDSCENLRDRIIYIDREDASLNDGYFIQDIIGCRVIDVETGRVYGEISDVSTTGANDVWHIKKGEQVYLIPVIDEVVKSVDIDNETVIIKPLKGIFEYED